MPVGSQPVSVQSSTQCLFAAGCYETTLVANPGAAQYLMLSSPFDNSVLGETLRINSGLETGLTLEESEVDDIFAHQLWSYNGTAYEEMQNKIILPWSGFWVATLPNASNSPAPKLLFPSSQTQVNLHVTATTGANLTDVNITVLKNGIEQSMANITETSGEIAFPLEPDVEYTLSFSKQGFANQIQRIKTPTAGQKVNLDVLLIPRGTQQTVADQPNVTLSDTTGSTVSLSNPQFIDSQGNAVNVSDGVNLTITSVDVSTPAGVAAFPGDFSGIPTAQSDATPIVSYGTVEYQFTRSSDGEELQLQPSQQAEIQIPLYVTKYQDGANIFAGDIVPFWSLNETTGIWTQEGTGTVVASANSPTGLTLQATASHFTWFSIAIPILIDQATAIVTVTAPEAGTALIKARTIPDIGWEPNTVDTVIPVGSSTGELVIAIPSYGKTCFWAEINFTSGNTATTPENCVTASTEVINITLEIQDGPLNLVASPQQNITALANLSVVQTKIQPTTIESQVDYVLESGILPAGITLHSLNTTTAVLSGVPTQLGTNTFVIKGTDVDGNSATIAMTYTVLYIASVPPPLTLEQLTEKIQTGADVTRVNTSQITDMSSLFYNLTSFNQDISNWDVGNVTDMSGMFQNASSFNQDISNWDVGNVTFISGMFYGATSFNQDINNWNVGNVTSMNHMFEGATSFNQNISNWDVSNVLYMQSMFNNATSFNQDISNWSVGNVTNMGQMFRGTTNFNQDIGNWNVGNVTNMNQMFYGATNFTNQNLSSWNISNVDMHFDFFEEAGSGNIEPIWPITLIQLSDMIENGEDVTQVNTSQIADMSYLFDGRTSFNQNISNWDVSNVTNMTSMFNNTIFFNQDISNWNVGNVTNMKFMFSQATSFNQDISIWDVGNVTDMNNMFNNATNFNQDISNWDVSIVTTMELMFSAATSFNQELGSWDVGNVTNMRFMFSQATSFNQDISNWNVSNVTNMGSMFFNAANFTNQDLSNWNVSNVNDYDNFFDGAGLDNIEPFLVLTKIQLLEMIHNGEDVTQVDTSHITDMSSLFENLTSFNQDISNWDVGNVKNMRYMFRGATSFNQDISTWGVGNVTNMIGMFERATSFNQDISNWDVGNVNSMIGMFASATSFNQDISNWDVGNVIDIGGMFHDATSFNQDISNWNVSNVSYIDYMFGDATSFNQDISNWNVSNVLHMQSMFENATSFNQDISNWDVANVENMDQMFRGATNFNQDIGNWNVGNVTNMNQMFYGATNFTNQDLSGWNVSNVGHYEHGNFFYQTGPGNIEPIWYGP